MHHESAIESRYQKMMDAEEGGATCLANLEAILANNGSDMSLHSLARSLYRYTETGVWLSALLHDGTWRYSGDLEGLKNDNVRGLLVGSIVEGSDAQVTGNLIDLFRYDETEKCVTDFLEEVERVDEEASAIWDEVNHEDSESN